MDFHPDYSPGAWHNKGELLLRSAPGTEACLELCDPSPSFVECLRYMGKLGTLVEMIYNIAYSL